MDEDSKVLSAKELEEVNGGFDYYSHKVESLNDVDEKPKQNDSLTQGIESYCLII